MRLANSVIGWAGLIAYLGALSAGCTALIDSSQYVGGGGTDGGTPDGGGSDAMVDPDGPSAPEIELGPASPRTADDLVVTITTESTDPLDGTVTYEYRWLRNGTVVEGETGDTLAGSLTTKGETWRVEVTPVASPGDRRGAAATAEVTIENTPPVLTTVAFDRYIVAVGEMMRSTPGPVVDPDGDATSLRLQWHRNDTAIASATGATLATSGFEAGDRVELEAWVTDGQAESEHIRVGPVTLEPAVTRWRPVAPSAFDQLTSGLVYDEQHRRWVSFEGGFLWERWVSSGRVRTAAIPVTGVGPAEGNLAVVLHDVEGRRVLYRSVADPATVYVLDLSKRGGETWSTLAPSGVAPDIRFGPATYYDRATRTLWAYGGYNPSLSPALGDRLWSLVLTPGSETWRSHNITGVAPPGGFAAALARDPARSDVVYLLGGAQDGGGLTGSTAIYRLTLSASDVESEQLSVELPRPVIGAAAASTDDAIIVAGGSSDIDDFDVPFGTIRYEPATGNMESFEPGAPPGVFAMLVADPDDSSRLLFWRGGVDEEVAFDGSGAGFELRALAPSDGTITDIAIEQRPAGISEASVSGRNGEPEAAIVGGRFDDYTASPVIWVYRKSSDEWTTRTIMEDPVISASPAPRWGNRFFDTSRHGGLQVFGGLTSDLVLADMEVWDVDSGRWLRRSLVDGAMPPVARTGAAIIASGGCGHQRNYVFGGERLDGTLLSDAPTLECPHDEPRSCVWEPRASGGSAPSARSFATMGFDRNQHVWLVGGRTATGPSAQVYSFHACSGGPATWNSVVPVGTPPAPRYAHSMSLIEGNSDGRLDTYVVFGGTGAEATESVLGDAWQLEITSTTSARWSEIVPQTALRPAPRAYHQSFWDEARSRLVVFGGRDPFQTMSDVWELIVVP